MRASTARASSRSSAPSTRPGTWPAWSGSYTRTPYVTDGSGEVSAARKLIHGGERIAAVGGKLALVFHREGRVCSVDTVQITDGLITAYRRVINPDKLVRV
jgi:hypothetical protein